MSETESQKREVGDIEDERQREEMERKGDGERQSEKRQEWEERRGRQRVRRETE